MYVQVIVDANKKKQKFLNSNCHAPYKPHYIRCVVVVVSTSTTAVRTSFMSMHVPHTPHANNCIPTMHGCAWCTKVGLGW